MARRSGGQFDGDQYMEAAQGVLRWIIRRSFIFWGIALGALVVAWLATGVYTINPRERGVVRLFGQFSTTTEPGLNWRIPSPITSLVRVDVETIRTAAVGFRVDDVGLVTRIADEALMLTTDNSIVEAQMVVQYRVHDARDFVFNVNNPEDVLHTTAEVALRSIVGRTNLVAVLTVGRATVEQETRSFLVALLETYGVGLEITDVKLQTVDPPDQVKDAFQEVVRALEDETRLENEAKGYEADQVPRAQGEVQVRIRSSAAYNQQQVERARGEANRFLALLQEYRQAPRVTRERLYLETMESVLGTVDKVLIDSQVDILPLLNIEQLAGP